MLGSGELEVMLLMLLVMDQREYQSWSGGGCGGLYDAAIGPRVGAAFRFGTGTCKHHTH